MTIREITFTTNAESYTAKKLLVERPGLQTMVEKRLGILFCDVSEKAVVFDGNKKQTEELTTVFTKLADLVEKEHPLNKSALKWALDEARPR